MKKYLYCGLVLLLILMVTFSGCTSRSKSGGGENPPHIPTITTIAGTGKVEGYDGDGGPATSARLNQPSGVTVDSAGNIYIADYGNDRVRKVDADGNINTMVYDDHAPTPVGSYVPYGVAVDSYGNIYFSNNTINCIYKKDSTSGQFSLIAGTGDQAFGGDDGPAKEAKLDNPYDVAVDSDGNLYIADTNNHRIRKVDSNGIITTIAGTGENGYAGDGGPAASAKINEPWGIAVDSLGNIYIADTKNHCIRKIE